MSKKTPAASAKAAAKPAPAAPAAAPRPQADEAQAAAFDQMMAIVGQIATEPGALVAPHQPIDRLERARALPEIPKDVESRPAGEPIRSFKDADRRTMNVVIVAGELFKQEV